MGERGEEEIEVVTSSLHQMSHLVVDLIRCQSQFKIISRDRIHGSIGLKIVEFEYIFNLPP